MRLDANTLAKLGKGHPLVKALVTQGHLKPGSMKVAAPVKRARATGAPKALSIGEETFALHLRAHGLPAPEREYEFHPTRKFRMDFAWPTIDGSTRKLAVEIEGGIHSRGRHVRPQGYKDDLTKYNSAVELGWTLLRFSSSMVHNGEAIQQVVAFFNSIRT